MTTTNSEPVQTGFEEFYGYIVPPGMLEHLEEATASFKRISEEIDNGTLVCGKVYLVECSLVTCGNSRIRCTPFGCFNELYWDWENSDSEAHLAAIAKFEIWEQWLREHNALPEDYRRPRLSHLGSHITGSLLGSDIGAVLSAFNGGNASWCYGVCSQRGVTLGSCEKCIYSYAHNSPDQSNTETVVAFTGYAKALGFETHRSENNRAEHAVETHTEPYAEFRGCMIPQGLTPGDEAVENFMKIHDMLTADDCSVDDTHTLAHCGELRCDQIECDHCLNYGFFGNCETPEKQLESIVRFQRWEDWLLEAEKLPGGYRPPVLHYRGLDIPDSLFHALRTAETSHSQNCLDEFNRGNDCWCRFVSCPGSGVTCAGCIYCSNYGDHQQKVQAFAEYAQACGYTTNRQPSVNDTIAVEPSRSLWVRYNPDDAKQLQNSIVGVHFIESPLIIGTDKVVGDDDLLPKEIVVPANVTREKKAWQKALQHFNEGYSGWCEGLECPRGIHDCKECLFSSTNPEAETQFTELMGKLGWEVTRAKGDDYRINEVVPDERSVDYSMSTESFDDPYRLPKLQINDIVQLDSPFSINGHSRTNCLWVMGPAIMTFDHQPLPGDYHCLAVDFESEGEGVRLGYIYRMSGPAGIHDPEAFVVSCKHIRKVYRFYRDGGFPSINGNNIRWNLNGTSSSCANVWTAGE